MEETADSVDAKTAIFRDDIAVRIEQPVEDETLVEKEPPVERQKPVEDGVPVEKEVSAEDGLPLQDELPFQNEHAVEIEQTLEDETTVEKEQLPPLEEEPTQSADTGVSKWVLERPQTPPPTNKNRLSSQSITLKSSEDNKRLSVRTCGSP
jgi:hypothetical protein